jgi:hypothetical protein
MKNLLKVMPLVVALSLYLLFKFSSGADAQTVDSFAAGFESGCLENPDGSFDSQEKMERFCSCAVKRIKSDFSNSEVAILEKISPETIMENIERLVAGKEPTQGFPAEGMRFILVIAKCTVQQ